MTQGQNLLPKNGAAYLYPSFIDPLEAALHCQNLSREIPWEQEIVLMFGKELRPKRQVCWMADEGLNYTYAGREKRAQAWHPLVEELKLSIEAHSGSRYNSCLLNFYPSGEGSMGWHRDNERELVPQGSIASLSLGAHRKFSFKHKDTREKVDLFLASGDLLLMEGECQDYWYHALPKSKRVSEGRINLTFRQFRV